MKKVLVTTALVAVMGCCVYTHRRVIGACLGKNEMPQAPKWHFWCKNRKTD